MGRKEVDKSDRAPELLQSRDSIRYLTCKPVRITLKLPLYRLVEATKKERGITRTDVINEALELYYKKVSNE